MANAKFCGLALLQLATFGDAQLVFMFPQRGGEIAQREQPAHVTVSKFSAMGSDGQMHTETHKVFTETSSDGLQKRMTEVDCKDGDCSKSVSHFFNGFPGMFSSMSPSNIFKGMPRMEGPMAMPAMPAMPAMAEKMQSMMHSTSPTFQIDIPMKLKMMMHRMHHMHRHMMHHMMHFRGGAEHQEPPQMPVQHVTLHFLEPRVMQPPEVVQTAAAPDMVDDMPVEAQVLAGVAFLSFVILFITLARACLFGKAQARERPLQELGQPLAPEAEAELGLAAGVVVRPQALADFVKMPPTPTQTYLLDLYARAGKPTNEAELATVVLRDVYAAALARATAV